MTTNTSAAWARTRGEWLTRRPWTAARANPLASAPAAAKQAAGLTTADCGRRLVVLILVTWAGSFVVSFQSTLMFLNLVGFAAAIAGLRWPSLGLMGIGMLSTLDPITGPFLATGGLWRWNNLNYWLLFVFVAFLPGVLRVNDPHSRLLQILTLLMIAGLSISPDLYQGFQYVFTMVTAFSLLVYCARVGRDPETWYWLAIVTSVLSGAGSLVYILRIDALPYLNRNIYCLFPLTSLFTICLASHLANNAGKQMALGSLAVINFVWVFLSASRGGTITGAVCMVFLLFQVRGLSRRFALVGVGAVVGTVILSQFAGSQEFALGRITETLDSSRSHAERTNNRSQLAVAGWNIFLNHPFGVGTAGFSRAQSELALYKWSRSNDFAAHSGWVRVLAENGILGIAALAVYVFSYAVVGWTRRRRGLLNLGLLITAVLAISLISYEFEHKGVWLLAMGATVLIHHLHWSDRTRLAL